MSDLPSSYNNLEEYTEDLCQFIKTPIVRQITGGIHVNDALIYNAWEALPQEWTSWWSLWPDHRLAQQHLIDSIDEELKPGANPHAEATSMVNTRPESLTKWLRTMKALALPRGQRPGPVLDLPEILRTRMKPKKIAEVSRGAAYIHDACQQRGITHVIDMGSGQGYLSVTLAHLFPHLRVLSIDGSESQISGSRSFATSLDIPESRLEHMVHWIDGSPALAAKIEDWAGGEKCILVGLHACGSLSEHMLRCFTTVSCIQALAVVGCCYNHIVPRSPSCPAGFPISSALGKRNVTLTPTALMTGCQSPNNWKRADVGRDQQEDSIFGRRRLYRAILEKIFFDKGIKIGAGPEERPAWGTRKGDMASFTRFAHKAMDCLGIARDMIPPAELEAYEERYRHCNGQVAILWTLSVLCCKVVESVIAMDRYWFLVEQGARGVDVVPVFDVTVSPRNLMMVADKGGSYL